MGVVVTCVAKRCWLLGEESWSVFGKLKPAAKPRLLSFPPGAIVGSTAPTQTYYMLAEGRNMISKHHRVDSNLSGVQHVCMWPARDGEEIFAASPAERRSWKDPAAARNVALRAITAVLMPIRPSYIHADGRDKLQMDRKVDSNLSGVQHMSIWPSRDERGYATRQVLFPEAHYTALRSHQGGILHTFRESR
ncbi:uncharacterized protein MYCFIDRAFT_85087 [Pseudocercospora fijiensis CIRAD86]|uniref:Uncharacterized protein n=1 Tax=Pseudocercospora fijiensis (strain CIRAD86) TaxID=383855 RepID=M3B2V9_PSEFD|nr:uncharacterized protein MYCFIDRAFT_85087 [Pseudocercospora fijiensis CIRAD86]EME83717.1 hypothetical protein MYCFIDRAFT_85087 [Pseudocercospora fijiensis CIRAD86]